ncbi:MAG: biotin--[Clostridia bacterium]|nr:biotin--[acetyl-CoA-carboxylase] ligase [Clostridia bacterium]
MPNDKFLNDITESELKAELGAAFSEFSIRVFETLDSTNTEAKRQAMAGIRRSLTVAKSQSAGRGRMGRSFYSPAGSGVYFSLLLPFPGGLERTVFLTCAASVAVMRAVRTLTGKQTEIKWVNDLFFQGKKVCGILCESVILGDTPSVIVGIGINVRSGEFPAELAEIAGSLCEDKLSENQLIAAVCRELISFLEDPRDASWLADYRNHSLVLGKPVVFTRGDETFCGIAEAILEDGALLVRDKDGKEHFLRTGEISLRLSDH